jgi:hypothetical protein
MEEKLSPREKLNRTLCPCSRRRARSNLASYQLAKTEREQLARKNVYTFNTLNSAYQGMVVPS